MDVGDSGVNSLGLHSIERCGEDDASGECSESFENVVEGETLGTNDGGWDCTGADGCN